MARTSAAGSPSNLKGVGRAARIPYRPRRNESGPLARAQQRYFGDDDKRQKKFSWFNDSYTPNPKHEGDGCGRRAVAQLAPNPWGLHDMLGNVWEWCNDRRVDERTGESRDPVMRGGSWRSGAFHCTGVAHDPGDPRHKGDNIGVRVVCTVAK